MAAFLGRALGLPAAGGDTFSDDNDSVFESDIERFAAAGITRGCSSTRFCPDDPVTRGQMAAFLARAYDLPEADRDYFSDDSGSIFEDAINRLAASGITSGCTSSSFCANEEVTRGQMAAFLRRADSNG
jgi:predicted deacylase